MEKKLTVLSISDDQRDQQLIQQALEGDFDVISAYSCWSGLESLCTHHPDAILLNSNISSVDSAKISRMIRAEPSFNNTPILVVSSDSSSDIMLETLQAGGNDFICRPFDFDDIKQKLQFNIARKIPPRTYIDASNQAPTLSRNLEILHEFLINLVHIDDLTSLSQSLMKTLELLQLRGAVHFHCSNHLVSSLGPLTDLESLLLKQAKSPYPTEYSARYIWGGEQLAAMIQNMPLAKSDTYQPLVELLATLFKSCNEKMGQLYSGENGAQRDINLGSEGQHSIAKLRRIVEEMESINDDCLSRTSQKLQEWLNNATQSSEQQKQFHTLFNLCIRSRVAMYDHRLEAIELLDRLEAASYNAEIA